LLNIISNSFHSVFSFSRYSFISSQTKHVIEINYERQRTNIFKTPEINWRKEEKKSGWISRSSGSGKKEQKDTTIVYEIRPYETYEEYLASFETPEK